MTALARITAEGMPHTVLIVDDDPIGREMVGALLLNQGYNLAFAQSGLEACEKAVALIPDLILLDVVMSGMDGIEACQRIRAEPQLAEVPIIMITALDDREIRLRSIEAGADDFVTKPLDFFELVARVRAILRLNRYRRLLMERSQRQRAEEEMLQRNRELSLLNRLILSAAAQPRLTDDLRRILREACEALSQVFDLPRGRAALLDEQGRILEPITLGGVLPGPPLSLSLPAILDHASEPLVIEGAQSDPLLARAHADLLADQIDTLLIAPIMLEGARLAGVIELYSQTRRSFTQSDLAFVRSVAVAVRQAVENARLHQQLQRYVDTLEETVARRTQELSAQRDRTTAILEALGEAVIVTNADTIIDYVNPATAQLTGQPTEALLGRSWTAGLPPRTASLFNEIRASVEAGETWRGEVPGHRNDGTAFDAAMTVAPLFDPANPERPAGFVSIQRDITPLKVAERLKDQFVSNISHELRTPLSIIAIHSGNLDTLYERLSDAQRRRLIGEIRTQANLLDSLIVDVLEVMRIDSDRLITQIEPVDLAQLLRSELDHQRPLAARQQQMLRVEGEEWVPAQGDERQLRQVLRNLINNAIKYTPVGGQISCACRMIDGAALDPAWPGSDELGSGRWAAVRVTDSGIGIPAEHIPHLFERFYRVHNQVNVPGTGLGLAITRELIARHGGRLGVASTPGEGSTFAFYVPLV